MKHLKLAMICLGFALTATFATIAEAGSVKEPPRDSRTEKTEEMERPRRFERLPAMKFVSGVLSRSFTSGWQIGETPLYLHKDCVITMDGSEEGFLVDGRQAVVMGSMVGESINAWSVYMPTPDYQTGGQNESKMVKEPGYDPNVGRILKKVD